MAKKNSKVASKEINNASVTLIIIFCSIIAGAIGYLIGLYQ